MALSAPESEDGGVTSGSPNHTDTNGTTRQEALRVVQRVATNN